MIDFNDLVKNKKDELLNDLKTLCQVKSVLDEGTADENQPFGEGCKKALDAMLNIGIRDGFEVENVDGYAGHIDIGEGDETFGILGHLDVVPCNDTGWDVEPYDCTLDHNVLYGRGVADDKGPLLAGYYAAKIINELDFEKKMKIRVIFGCNEENGSSCMKYYFEHRPFPAMGFTPDAEFPVVYGEKAGAHFYINTDLEKDNIIGIYSGTRLNIVPETAEAYVEGQYKLYEESFNAFLKEYNIEGSIEEEGNHTKFIVVGKSAHASTPEQGVNGATYLCHYLVTISSNPFVKFVDDYFFDDFYGEKAGVAYEGALGKLTLNPGILTYKNSHATLGIDMRVPHEVTEEQLVKQMHKIIDPYQFSEEHHLGKALFVDPQSELITKLHNSYVEFTNDTTHFPQAIGGGTYAKTMPNCVAFGIEFPGENNQIHQNNENIHVDSLLKATAIYAKALYDLIKK